MTGRVPGQDDWRDYYEEQLDEVVPLDEELTAVYGDEQVEEVVDRVDIADRRVYKLKDCWHPVVVVVLEAVWVTICAKAVLGHVVLLRNDFVYVL